jgi:hypothetical protein
MYRNDFDSAYEQASNALEEDRALAALEFCSRMMALQPDNYLGYYTMGMAHLYLQQYALAYESFSVVVDMKTVTIRPTTS